MMMMKPTKTRIAERLKMMVKILQISLIEANKLPCAHKSFSKIHPLNRVLFYGLHLMGIVLKVITTVAPLFSISIYIATHHKYHIEKIFHVSQTKAKLQGNYFKKILYT